jgi:aspartyl/asparaginyl beta-hydroxylase (cupin superfamily)
LENLNSFVVNITSSSMTAQGNEAKRFRAEDRNRDDAIERLIELVCAAVQSKRRKENKAHGHL